MATEVKGDGQETLLGYGDRGELAEPATVAGVAVDHGDKAAELRLRQLGRAPRLSEDVHVLVVEDELLLVEDAMLLVELFLCEVSKGALAIGLLYGVSH